tara:strand:- start:44 stop:274 length:231 start_codon:yes stop_codon:yes gene_type:complete
MPSYYERNREARIKYQLEYYKNNKLYILEKQKEYFKIYYQKRKLKNLDLNKIDKRRKKPPPEGIRQKISPSIIVSF